VVTGGVVTGVRLVRQRNSDEWLSGDVLNLLFRCWSPFEANRPEPTVIVNTLNDAGDVFELRSEGLSEPDLNRFLNDCKGGPEGDQDRKKATAQGLVDKLDLVRPFGIKYLRWPEHIPRLLITEGYIGENVRSVRSTCANCVVFLAFFRNLSR